MESRKVFFVAQLLRMPINQSGFNGMSFFGFCCGSSGGDVSAGFG